MKDDYYDYSIEENGAFLQNCPAVFHLFYRDSVIVSKKVTLYKDKSVWKKLCTCNLCHGFNRVSS